MRFLSGAWTRRLNHQLANNKTVPAWFFYAGLIHDGSSWKDGKTLHEHCSCGLWDVRVIKSNMPRLHKVASRLPGRIEIWSQDECILLLGQGWESMHGGYTDWQRKPSRWLPLSTAQRAAQWEFSDWCGKCSAVKNNVQAYFSATLNSL